MSPGKGRILQRFTDYPTPINLTTPIFSIKADALPWKVNAELTEQEINLINRNDPVAVYFHGIANTSFSGKIDKIALHTNKNSLLEVQISLEKSSAFFRSGLNTTNTIKTQQQYQGYFVPLTVFTHLKNNSGSLFLLKKGGETVRKIAVEISIIQGVDALVSTDLSEFNRIIVAGQHNLKNGSQVYIIE